MISLRKKRKAMSIPMSSMGDIAFLLMIFYMATTLVTDQKPLELILPEVESETMSSPYPLIIYLDHERAQKRQVYFFNQNIPYEKLSGVILDRATDAPAAVRVYLNIEKNIPYSHMQEIINSLKEAGIANLIITTTPPKSQGGSK
ncbi:MAG: biopolymer transporter ExbD [Spirochaetia bacterium]|nr:biopolymer transporter ExbD [Spirochaetia bacterium]